MYQGGGQGSKSLKQPITLYQGVEHREEVGGAKKPLGLLSVIHFLQLLSLPEVQHEVAAKRTGTGAGGCRLTLRTLPVSVPLKGAEDPGHHLDYHGI